MRAPQFGWIRLGQQCGDRQAAFQIEHHGGYLRWNLQQTDRQRVLTSANNLRSDGGCESRSSGGNSLPPGRQSVRLLFMSFHRRSVVGQEHRFRKQGRSARQNASATAVVYCHGAQTRFGLRGGGRRRVLSTDAVAPPSLFAAPPLPADEGVAHRLLQTAHSGNATVWRFPEGISLRCRRRSKSPCSPASRIPRLPMRFWLRRASRRSHGSLQQAVSPSRLTPMWP